MAQVDVVVVTYQSRAVIRACVEPLAALDWVAVTVVDNASPDRTLEAVADLPLDAVQLPDNRGFARGCNAGWKRGSLPYVLFLNPDAGIDGSGLGRLAAVLDGDPRVGVVGPRIEHEDGSLAFSQRRFPRLRSTYSHAFFLHRLWPEAAWTSELVRDPRAYERPGSPEWISGACMLVRRSTLDAVGGFDEGFLLYCEDKDLCRRIRALGQDVRFEPGAVVRHRGGASAPRASLLPVLAASRVRYARKHRGGLAALLERAGVSLTALTHMAVTRGGRAARAGHARAFAASTGLRPQTKLPGEGR